MKNLMIDIETMGIKNNAAIISIGALFFSKNGTGSNFYKKINLQSCLDYNLSIDASTIIWWMQQSLEARQEFFNNNMEESIYNVLFDFSSFIYKYTTSEDLYVWSNGIHFDITILENAYQKCGIKIPWKYNHIRDFRTFKEFSYKPIEIPKDRNAHNALEDAIWQAEYAVEIMNERIIKKDK